MMTRDPMGRKMIGSGHTWNQQKVKRQAGTLVPGPELDDGTKKMMQQNKVVQGQAKTVALQAELQRTRTSMLPTGQQNYGLSREIANRGRRGF